jgi:flagellar basal-body rod protein FlgF
MDNSLYVGLSKQMVLQRQLDIIANNIANSDTSGFKVESLAETEDPKAPAFTLGGPEPVKFVMPNGVIRDFGQGALRRTDSPFDVALDGQGFFEVQTPAGPRYTRDGRFRLDPTGRLVTQDGDPVQGGGGDIVLDPKKGPVAIAANGDVSQSGQNVGKLSVVTFDTLSALSKDGANLFRNDSNLTAQPATGASLRQGMLEGSNVQPVSQITRLIEINRAYDAITSMMAQTGQLATSAVQRLGSLNPA